MFASNESERELFLTGCFSVAVAIIDPARTTARMPRNMYLRSMLRWCALSHVQVVAQT